MYKSDDDVGDLDTSIVYIILDFDAFSVRDKDVHKRVAEHRISDMPNVRSLIRVNARVFDHPFRRVLRCLRP